MSFFTRVDALSDIEDPATEPFRSKYAARKLLEERREAVASDTRECALIDFRLGVNFVDTEELGRADERLLGALATLCPANVPYDASVAPEGAEDGKEETKCAPPPTPPTDDDADAVFDESDDGALLDEDSLYAVVGSLNHLGVLWSHRGEHARAKVCLDKSRAAYFRCRALRPAGAPPTPPTEGAAAAAAAAAPAPAPSVRLESLYTHTCFYLAQVHANLGNAVLAARYCERTLERQAAGADVDMEWIKNCVGLADFHLGAGAMSGALRCVEVAEWQLARIVRTREEKGGAKESRKESTADDAATAVAVAAPEKEEDDDSCGGYDVVREDLEMLDADIARRRAAVYLTVLNQARDVLIGQGDPASDAGGMTPPFSSTGTGAVQPEYDAVAYAASGAALDPSRTRSFDDARALYRAASSALERAGKYYVLEGFVTEFVELKQNSSKLYNYLSAFEDSPKRKLAMAKRRLAILGPILLELNARVYTGIVRQLSFELGETSSQVFDLKRALVAAKLVSRDPPLATAAEQFTLNQLALAAIRQFEFFVRTFADKGGVATAGPNALPYDPAAAVGVASLIPVEEVVVDDDDCRVFLVAYFQAARMYGKLFDLLPAPTVRTQRVHALRASLLRYEWLVAFARKWPDRIESFRDELHISSEMASLLPTQIARLHRG